MIKVSALPVAQQLRAWKHALYQNITAASNRRDDRALTWANAVEAKGSKIEDFATSPEEFVTLDRKLAAALSKVAVGLLSSKIVMYSEQVMIDHKRTPRVRLRRRVVGSYCSSYCTTILPARMQRRCSASTICRRLLV